MIRPIPVVAFFVVITFAADPVAVGQRPTSHRAVRKFTPGYSDPNAGGGPAPGGPNGQVPQNYYGPPNGQMPQNYSRGAPGQMPQNYYAVPNAQVPQYYGQVPSGQMSYYQLAAVCAQQAQQVQDLQVLVDALYARIAELEASIQQLVPTNRTKPYE